MPASSGAGTPLLDDHHSLDSFCELVEKVIGEILPETIQLRAAIEREARERNSRTTE
ncbi:hypothetical protein ACTWQF_09955 [Streptomyces sp. 8N114]|uniref:hypothetical protein n=1 Tax=Streptomyces sp. 8N114 TaxID=3457419 RepID=UPI003FD531B6